MNRPKGRKPKILLAACLVLFAFPTFLAAESPSGLSKTLYAIDVDPQDLGTLYVDTRAGIFKGAHGGREWTNLRDKDSVVSLAVASPSVLYVGTAKSGLLKSTDGGGSYNRIAGGKPVTSLAIDPGSSESLWAGTDGYGLWRTSDGGGTWQEISGIASKSVTSVAVERGIVLVGTAGHGVFRSTDAGRLWKEINTGLVD
ncbi:MAG: hypothetical protein HYV63_14110 [Candidatus Schekmanbacteria bacterium]|nr:hypothetical protein [Candidatus Schekmanbacteria bacterium]